MKRTFPIIAFILLIFSSCQKDEATPESKPTYTSSTTYGYLDSSIFPYKFKAGSYWVYENDSTGMLDSIVVDTISTGFVITTPSVHGTTGQTEKEFYKMNLHSFGFSQYYNECLMTKGLIRNFGGDYFHFYGQSIYSSNSPVGTPYNGMEIFAKFPTMNVNANIFNNVDEVKITAAAQYQPEFLFDTYLYYCDSVGLVKKETILSPGNIESWSIKRWNLIR